MYNTAVNNYNNTVTIILLICYCLMINNNKIYSNIGKTIYIYFIYRLYHIHVYIIHILTYVIHIRAVFPLIYSIQ